MSSSELASGFVAHLALLQLQVCPAAIASLRTAVLQVSLLPREILRTVAEFMRSDASGNYLGRTDAAFRVLFAAVARPSADDPLFRAIYNVFVEKQESFQLPETKAADRYLPLSGTGISRRPVALERLQKCLERSDRKATME